MGIAQRRKKTQSTAKRGKSRKIPRETKQWMVRQTSFATRGLKSRLLGLHCLPTLSPNVSLKHTCHQLRRSSPCRRWWSILARRRNFTELWQFKVSIDFPKLACRSNFPSLAEELLNGVYQRYSQWEEKVLSSSRNLFAQSSSLPWVDSRERHEAG